MTYPFAQAPTVRDFIKSAESKAEAVLVTVSDGVSGPRGPTVIRYLERGDNGAIKRSQSLPEKDDERIGWHLLRCLCSQLGIDPCDLDLGLDLG